MQRNQHVDGSNNTLSDCLDHSECSGAFSAVAVCATPGKRNREAWEELSRMITSQTDLERMVLAARNEP